MTTTKKPQTPAKAEGKSAIQRHYRAAGSSSPLSTPSKTPASKRKGAASKSWAHSHIPPARTDRAKNGRQEGRNLITWTRPRMAEKLLLHIQYECSRYKIDLPWDSVAHRLHPGSSGGAILQHMNRLRNSLVAEGHLVPPICQKPGSRVTVDPTIRGYVRKFTEGPDTVTTRAVLFTEPMDDRKFNLPDAYDNHKVSASVKRENQGGVARKTSKPAIKAESPDPADLDSDADYDPNAKATGSRRRSARATAAKSYIEENNNYDLLDDEEEEVVEEPIEENEMDYEHGADEGDGDENEEDFADDEYPDDEAEIAEIGAEILVKAEASSSQDGYAADSSSHDASDVLYNHTDIYSDDHGSFDDNMPHLNNGSGFYQNGHADFDDELNIAPNSPRWDMSPRGYADDGSDADSGRRVPWSQQIDF